MDITLVNAFLNILNDYMDFNSIYYYEIHRINIIKNSIQFFIKEDDHFYILKIIYDNNQVKILNEDGQDCIYDFLEENGINKIDADNFYLKMEGYLVSKKGG